MKKNLLFPFFILFPFLVFAQLQTPDEFLGYQLGTAFTPHYKILQYFDHVQKNAPAKSIVQQYGYTNEKRELLVAIVSSPENISSIDDIRKNNLRITGMMNDKPATLNNKTIVWLSYNVHGNEASSSEVSMKTLYELVSGKNAQANEWLKNTIVIIDPCLNPDGRDRYVNWYNSIVGKNYNTSMNARERSEPWPGGRSNHYNFDLNRDWAWQTQVESRQRVQLYQQWMPQIHVDFHEQYYNNPYYFAPAAEPYHADITPWQRQAQTEIGRNHARYFDNNGWLYYTKELFDLLYPSYGDTYPIFNGSIGMTYEQAGHGMGGLGIAIDRYDTLRLTDRIAHHFTTSMSTIEYASLNAEKLQSNFKKYFDDANTGKAAQYQTYILSGNNQGKIEGVKLLLDKNNISYSFALGKQAINGFNYFTQKNEAYTVQPGDMVIYSAQPQSVLLNVLFDATPKLSDTATYDITAWAIPYAYGIETYGTNAKVAQTASANVDAANSFQSGAYGYIINYNSFEASKLLAALLKNGYRVRFSEREFVNKNEKFSRGSLIVLSADNKGKMNDFAALAKQFSSVKISQVGTGFMDSGFDFGSEKVRQIYKPNVAMLTGEGVSSLNAGEVWHFFDTQLNYPITLINANEVDGVNWKEIDVLIIPDGRYGFLSSKDRNGDIKNWVRQGGKIIAIDGAVAEMAKGEWGITAKKADEEKENTNDYSLLRKYENRDRDGLTGNIPGAIYKIELDATHPLAFGYENNYYILKNNATIYQFSKDAWNVGVLRNTKPFSGFVGSDVKAKLQNGTLIAAQQMGRGSIVYFTDNPIFRGFWENGKQMFSNAVFLVGN